MHDLLEGVCQYDILLILFKFVIEKKYFTIEQLNSRMNIHNYGPIVTNKPPLISKDFHKYNKLKLSAAEMLTFIENFSYYIGDLIPEGCEIWNLYILIRQIVIISFSKKVHVNLSDRLSDLISEHNELYIKLSQSHLKPKFHILLHYPYIMKKIGLLTTTSSMRFESFHQNFKRISYGTKCNKNMLETISKKNSIQLADFILNFEKITYSSSFNHGKLKLTEKEVLSKYSIFFSEDIFSVSFVLYESVKIKPNVVIRICDLNDEPVFAIVDLILKYRDQFYLAVNLLNNISFNFAYHVIKTNVFFTTPIRKIDLSTISYAFSSIDERLLVYFNYI